MAWPWAAVQGHSWSRGKSVDPRLRPDIRGSARARGRNRRRRRRFSRRRIEIGEQRGRRIAEPPQCFGAQRQGAGQAHRLWIHVDAVHEKFIVKVRPRGEPGHADVADDLALIYVRTDPEVLDEPGHVTVQGGHAVAVCKDDGLAVAAANAGETDASIGGYGKA